MKQVNELAQITSTAARMAEPRRVGKNLDETIEQAENALLAQQAAEGCWCYELEADCTIPAEYILMMHFMDEIDEALEMRLAAFLRHQQDHTGGWPLFYGGKLDISCTVKAYYALKLAGDTPDEPHMIRAREAILANGGAARANVFTRIMLAQFEQIPWRAIPFMPVELVLLPRWSPFHLSKISYWSRTVLVPLLILTSRKVKAVNPRQICVRELFTVDPEIERDYFPTRSVLNRAILYLERSARLAEPYVPGALRRRAIEEAERWFVERLNGEDGLGAIFPAMVNALLALRELGYATDHPLRKTALVALQKLLVNREVDGREMTYCQPCVSPIWDTGLASLALQESGSKRALSAVDTALAWLADKQITEVRGDWSDKRPDAPAGGWAFQYENDFYPDLDDTAVVAWAMHRSTDPVQFETAIERAIDWLAGMQSAGGGFAAFDADNEAYYLNEIPFADHGALLDPPTVDVSARCLTLLSLVGGMADRTVVERCVAYLHREQEADGSWFGRWGTNYIYGTWSALVALEAAGIRRDTPMIRRAVVWLKSLQRSDGSWGESNDNYWDQNFDSRSVPGTSYQTAWALLGLMAAGEVRSEAVASGIQFLRQSQTTEGGWREPWFSAPGFPRVFYLKYHGYSDYFPLWALSRYRRLTQDLG